MIKRSLRLLVAKRDYGFLMATQWLAQAADGLVQTSIATAIVFGGQKGFDPENARSPDEVLRIVLYTLIPYTVLSPFLGVVIDRWDRRRLLMLANGFRAVTVAGVGLWGVGAVGDIVLFATFLLTLMSTRVVLATKAAALPVTLSDTALVEGNALSQLGGALFQLGGVAVALVGKEVVGPEPVLLAGAAVYALGALAPRFIELPRASREKRSLGGELARTASNVADGVREVARHPRAGASITTYFWLRYLWSFTLVGIGLIAQGLLSNDRAIAVLTGGAGAVGAALGFLLAGVLSRRTRTTGKLVLTAGAVAGVAVTTLGGIERVAVLPVLTFFLGLGFFVGKISLDTMVQQALGDDFRGRAFSLYDIAYNFAWLLAAALLKLTWGDEGNGLVVAAMGVVFLTGLAAIGLWYRRAGLLVPLASEQEA